VKRTVLATLAIVLSLALIGPGRVLAEDRETIFYNVTTDEAWAAGMAMGQANKALDNGYGVVIFLNVRGVFLAAKAFKSDISGATGKGIQAMLKAAMEKGARVIICPMCLAKAGLTMDGLIEGVVKGGPDVTLKAMTADDTVIISY